MSAIDKSKITTDEQLLIWLAAQSNPNITQENMAKHHIDRASVKTVSFDPYIREGELTYTDRPGEKYTIRWKTVLPTDLFTPEELIVVVPSADWTSAKLTDRTRKLWNARMEIVKTVPVKMREDPSLVREDNSVVYNVTDMSTVRCHYYTDETAYHLQGAFTVRYYRDTLPLKMLVANTNLGGFTAQQLTQED